MTVKKPPVSHPPPIGYIPENRNPQVKGVKSTCTQCKIRFRWVDHPELCYWCATGREEKPN